MRACRQGAGAQHRLDHNVRAAERVEGACDRRRIGPVGPDRRDGRRAAVGQFLQIGLAAVPADHPERVEQPGRPVDPLQHCHEGVGLFHVIPARADDDGIETRGVETGIVPDYRHELDTGGGAGRGQGADLELILEMVGAGVGMVAEHAGRGEEGDAGHGPALAEGLRTASLVLAPGCS